MTFNVTRPKTRKPRTALSLALCALSATALLAGCVNHHKTVTTHSIKAGWTVADRPRAVEPGTEITAHEAGKFFFATSLNPKSDASSGFTMVLSPAFRAHTPAPSPPPPNWSAPGPGKAIVELVAPPPKMSQNSQSSMGDAGASSMTEPRAFVKSGVAYLWGRWPLIGTGWVSGAPSGNTTERSRVIVWIDDQLNPTVQRIFFNPTEPGQKFTVQLEPPICPGPGPSSIEMTALSYVEIVEGPGGCKTFLTPEPILRESNGWADPRVEQFWQTVQQ